jgi:hypothetical protein
VSPSLFASFPCVSDTMCLFSCLFFSFLKKKKEKENCDVIFYFIFLVFTFFIGGRV